MTSEFYTTLAENTTAGISGQTAVLDVLNEFCESIQKYGNSPELAKRLAIQEKVPVVPLATHRVECILERGMLVTMGQEWRVKLRATQRNYEQILLRAYVSVKGYPVMLDLYEEDMIECKREATLRRHLKEFLKSILYRRFSGSVRSAVKPL